MFGSQKPAFGNTSTTGTSLFGGGNAAGFGNNTATTGFGGTGATSGFGANNQPNQTNQTNQTNQGTGTTPFSEHTEKEGAGASQTNSKYQSITAMPNYQQWSFEELRVADYLQGRKTGNANGQAGSFGQTTGFGGFTGTNTASSTSGFGNTSGGLFGANQNTNTNTTGFGSTGTGFSNTSNTSGGGLFGSKPASGGLFGSTPASSSQTTGGLFGTTNNNATGGFAGAGGSFGNTNTGGLFGSGNQQKPGFNAFGSSNQSGGFGNFGQANPSSGGLFGGSNQQPGNTTFGNTNAQGGGFGNFGANNQNQNQGQGLFGNANQPKPGGLFGSTAATGGSSLFNNAGSSQTNTGPGLFGGAGNQPSGGSLFGGKPAAAGASLFNNNPASTNTSGLFNNLGNNNQQNAGGGLFGNTNTQQKPLFSLSNAGSNQNPAASGSGFFGGNNAGGSNLGNSLFSNSQQSQSSNFNNSQQTITAPLTTSIGASNPYGHEQLFQSLNATPTQSVGPLATPLSSSQKQRKPMPLPQHRLNPNAASRFITPQKRTGYGFSYSTYGTPGSGQVSPYNNNLAVNSFGRSLGKSFSTSNLRNSFTAEDSVLVPGILSPSARSFNNASSMKKLHIDRNFETRRPLFGSNANDDVTGPQAKRVSFQDTTGGTASLAATSTDLVRVDDSTPPRQNGTGANGTALRADGNPTRGDELSTVAEEQTPPSALAGAKEAAAAARSRAKLNQEDQPLGDYWSTPTLSELKRMSPEQLKKVQLTAGREGAGKVEFSETDLNGFPFDKLLGNVVHMDIRQVSVYGEVSNVPKPPRGKDLNVPSRITLENSWPRAEGGTLPVHEKKGPRFEKHIRRLKRVRNTEFEHYDSKEGLWIFRVQHFTTYGLDYEGQPAELDEMDSSMWTDVPGTPTPVSKTPSQRNSSQRAAISQPTNVAVSPALSSPDDTFDFKKGKKKSAPGGFDDEAGISDDESETYDSLDNTQQSFLDERSVGLPHDGHNDDANHDGGYEEEQELDMAGSFPGAPHTAEPFPVKAETAPQNQLKSILKESRFPRPDLGTPSKTHFEMGADWTEQLQRTVSPKKQDRRTLRDNQSTILEERNQNTVPTTNANIAGKGFTTSIDLMNSLFGQSTKAVSSEKQIAAGKGFEVGFFSFLNV